MNKLLITGATAFSAMHLVEVIHSDIYRKFECHGTSRTPSRSGRWQSYHVGDITDEIFVRTLVGQISPTHVLHLAGSSNTLKTEELISVNLHGTWNLLSACSKLEFRPRILLVGSAAGFGEMQLSEENLGGTRRPRPNSLYGLVREQALQMGQFFNDIHELPVLRCRTFNLIGPSLPDKYAPAAILARILELSRKCQDTLPINNANYIRDFVDVRDACRAWISILLDGSLERVYSIGTGIPLTIRQLTETLLNCAGVRATISESDVPLHPNRSQISRSVADISELKIDTKWHPKYSLLQSIQDMIQHQRK